MKRINVLGLCLVAVFALSAVIASAAFAVDPEFQICGKAAKNGKVYTGKYSDKACSAAEPKGEGKYEREEWSKAKKMGFKAKNEGAPHNNIVNVFGEKKGGPTEPATIEGTTTCQQEKVTGTTTGPKTTTWKTEYKKCSAVVAKIPTECNTAKAKKGVITTEQLTAELVNL
ncbi:MAG TPA: hypothetical protein VMB91_12865, partial [Solirubrobacteraceae bacterium]|nr:hypothetical protein [Solirubrobacteraceae bacterium]